MSNTIVKNVIENCSLKWGFQIDDLEKKASQWLLPLQQKELTTEYSVLLKLLDNFNYYSHEEISIVCQKLYNSYINCEANYNSSIYLPVTSSTGIINHSYEILSKFKDNNHINKHCVIGDLTTYVTSDDYDLDLIFNLVFIDDISGSGNTIIKCLKHYMNKYPNIIREKNIYILLIEATPLSIQRIQSFKESNNLKITVIYHNIQKKAFDSNYIFPSTEAAQARELTQKLEWEIFEKKDSPFILGYNKSECLVSFYYNTPNNTLSVFWNSSSTFPWLPLFPRSRTNNPPFFKKKKPTRFKQKKQRTENAYKFKKG